MKAISHFPSTPGIAAVAAMRDAFPLVKRMEWQ